MSLYWQQAVQNRSSAPSAEQNYDNTRSQPQTEWQRNAVEPTQNSRQTYWNQESVNQVYPDYTYNQYYSLEQANSGVPYPSMVNYAYQPEQQGHLPQVSSLSSIPEFESVDFPTATTTSEIPIQNVPTQPFPVQEHPIVTLPTYHTEEIRSKSSAQVTPESSYSVDTFNSHQSKEEKKDDWDDWEQTPRESVHEKTPSVENTQPDSKHTNQSIRSRETTSATDHNVGTVDHAASEHEKSFEIQPVAQVAPLVKNPIEFDQLVARVGPVHAIDANVIRVAPTRPIQSAPAPASVISSVETGLSITNEIPQEHLSQVSLQQPQQIVQNVPVEIANVPQPTHQTQTILTISDQEENRITPNDDSLRVENIGQAQATSTPNDTIEEKTRLPERRSSVSSIRSGTQPLSGNLQNGEQSDSTQGSVAFTRGGVRASYQERYRGVKEKYLDSRNGGIQAYNRIDRHRVETPKMRNSNPLSVHDFSGRRSALQISARTKGEPSNSSFGTLDKTNYSQPDPTLNESVDINTNGVGYGEDFVDASRRSRMNRSRPPSRAKSDLGDDIPYHRGHNTHHQGRPFDYRGYPVHPQYFAYPSMGRHSGRMSATGMSYGHDYYQQQAMMYQRPRPQSTYDSRSMERFQKMGGNMINYDVYAPRHEDEDESCSDESDVVDEGGESEDEMKTYNMSNIPHGVNTSFSSYSMASNQRRSAPRYGPAEIYFFGVIRLDTHTVDEVFRKHHIPREFYTVLEPVERAAYLYYAVVYQKLFGPGVNDFQNMFKREYYKFICDGDLQTTALIKVCKSMYDEFMSRNRNTQQKAYEASQKQLFSDDRESADGLSDRASLYDREDDRASDILSIDQRAPWKYRTPHSFLKFGPAGKTITINAESSVSAVYIDDVKTMLRDNQSRWIIEAAQNFKGPLIPGRTASHSILLYIQNQIARIQHSEVAKENPHSCDVVDCLLLWRLLETVVKQQGRVTGPDIASLLVSVGPSISKKTLSNHREKSATPSIESIKSFPPDPKAYDLFTQFLLGGHIDEAVKCAVNNGLHADAMVLVRRIFAGDERKLAEIEQRFLATRPSSNPVMTLVAVASGQPAPVLTNPPIDDAGTWRQHAAIVLANLNTAHAKETVYGLGCVLAKREYHAAADFCFLAVSLLSNFDVNGVNVFQKPTVTSKDDDTEEQYISLIHASLPDDDWGSTSCRFGFSLTDLHATEIFDFAVKMAGAVSPLQNSPAFQQKRLQYAQILASLGGFNEEAFRYSISVASSIANYYHHFGVTLFTVDELTALADLADSLQMFNTDGPAETAWIDYIRQWVSSLNQQSIQNNAAFVSEGTQNEQNHQNDLVPNCVPETRQQHSDNNIGVEHNPISTRTRADSLAVEAHDWHADRQDPIQMSPSGSNTAPSSFRRESVATSTVSPVMSPLTEYQTPRSRADSISPPNGQQMYGEQLCQTQHIYNEAQIHKSEYETTSDSAETTSHESSPARQITSTVTSYSNESNGQHWQPTPEPPRPQQQYSSNKTVSETVVNQTPSLQQDSNELKKSANSNSSGLFSNMINKVRKFVPSVDDMKLPDDKNPTIRWDDNLKKWVGEGVEETVIAPPPMSLTAPTVAAPAMHQHIPAPSTMPSAASAVPNRLKTARYVRTMPSSSQQPTDMPVGNFATPPVPSFSFIPTMPDNAESVDPFSGEANPTIHAPGQFSEQLQ